MDMLQNILEDIDSLLTDFETYNDMGVETPKITKKINNSIEWIFLNLDANEVVKFVDNDDVCLEHGDAIKRMLQDARFTCH